MKKLCLYVFILSFTSISQAIIFIITSPETSKNVVRTAGDVFSLGQTARDREHDYTQLVAEKSRLERIRFEQERSTDLQNKKDRLQEIVKSRDYAIKVKDQNKHILDSIEYLMNWGSKQLSGEYKTERKTRQTKANTESLKQDLDLIKLFINNMQNKETQNTVAILLVETAKSRGLAVVEFINQTLSQVQVNQSSVNRMIKKLSSAHIVYIKFVKEQEDYINAQQEKVISLSDQIDTIHKSLADEKAAAAEAATKKAAAEAEAVRIRNEAYEYQERIPTTRERRMRD